MHLFISAGYAQPPQAAPQAGVAGGYNAGAGGAGAGGDPYSQQSQGGYNQAQAPPPQSGGGAGGYGQQQVTGILMVNSLNSLYLL